MVLQVQTKHSKVRFFLLKRLGLVIVRHSNSILFFLSQSSTVVSKAFQILSDRDKRSAYDRFGGDPDSRFGSASAASGGRSAQFRGRGGDEIDPRDLFEMFFGAGTGGIPGMGGECRLQDSINQTSRISTKFLNKPGILLLFRRSSIFQFWTWNAIPEFRSRC